MEDAVWRDILGAFGARVTKYLQNTIDANTLANRMDETVFRFKNVGYREYFAGHEGRIRLEIFRATSTDRASELRRVSIAAPHTQKLAAWYMAFTDFLP